MSRDFLLKTGIIFGFSVIFPDLNWISTCGATLKEAMESAVDCLAGYIYTSEKTNEIYSLPSALSDIHLDKIAIDLNIPADDAFINMISVDVEFFANITGSAY